MPFCPTCKSYKCRTKITSAPLVMESLYVSSSDKAILRELAKQQLEYGKNQRNESLIKEWYKHNELQGSRPMIHLEAATFEQELLPQRMKCEGDFARRIEKQLYSNFLNEELFDDDRVTPDYFGISYDSFFTLFGIDIEVEQAFDSKGNKSVGHQFKLIINDLEQDYHKLKKSVFGVNKESTMARLNAVSETIGDIIPVRIEGFSPYSVPTQMIVHIMGMENMMYNMYDYPDLFKEMMNRIADDTLEYFNLLERENVLLSTTSGQHLSQGSWCYNKTLPNNKNAYLIKDLWGFLDSQETVSISPQMYEEFIFPCYKRIADCFGLLSYGCCEPVDPIWESCLSRLSNLRKVSISPWCNQAYMGERLCKSNIIFHRKPSPNYLGVEKNLDEEAFRLHIRETLQFAKGCKLEITQRDVYTIDNNTDKAKRYIDIIKEEIQSNWQA